MRNLKLIPYEMTGQVHVTENSQFNSIEADIVVLDENVTARLFGQIKDIILKKGSIAFVHGTVTGKVENEGGQIHIF